jgi:hypothetical protein
MFVDVVVVVVVVLMVLIVRRWSSFSGLCLSARPCSIVVSRPHRPSVFLRYRHAGGRCVDRMLTGV